MTLAATQIPVGEWLPDLPPLNNPGAIEAKNCIPQEVSYRSLNSLQAFTNALNSAALGAIWLQANDNTIFNFAGDVSKLYRLDSGTTWADVSKAGGYSAVVNWEFTKFGERVVAVADGENCQYYDVGVSSLFADLPGSPPVAARVGVIRDFIVLGDLQAYGPNFIAWGGFNSSELWTPSRATQSDRQELFGRGGRVQRIVPGQYGVIFQEHSIWRMEYVGPPIIFQLDEVERGRGTPAPNSVAWTGRQVYYYGHDGFYAFDGAQSTPIGVDRVNRWFEANADSTALNSMRGVVDRLNRLVIWAFKSSSSLANNDHIIIYNWASNKWGHAQVDTQILAEFVSSGFSLDQLDVPLPAGIDIDSINVDSNAFKGGVLSLQAFDSSNKSATFSGDPLTAVIDTQEQSPADGRTRFINSVRPIVDSAPTTDITVQAGTRDAQTGNVLFDAPRSLNTIGEANMRIKSRYQRYRLNISGGFNHAHGAEAFGRVAGRK